MTQRVAVIGDGGWGTALALVLCENGHNVTVWGPFADYIDTVIAKKENHEFLPDVPLPPELRWTASREDAVVDADVIVLACPTKFYRDVVGSFRGLVSPTSLVVSVAKGLDQKTHRRMSQLAGELLDIETVSALSGPSHAEEVARGIPTAVCIASDNPDSAKLLQSLFSNHYFRVYTSDDPAGVELGGALKNVIAIAVGMSDGLGFGDNTRAALITRGLSEITRLGVAMGARQSTFAGLSGMGDLIVTCTSHLSRNRAIGERLGKGESIDQILGATKQAAEGIWNCASAKELADEHGVDVPITDEVYAIVHQDKDPQKAVTSLLEREVKPETA